MPSEPSQAARALILAEAAQEFANEVAGQSERRKKDLPAPPGLRTFLLYVRANGHVPLHQVSGPITIQGVLGDSRIQTPDDTYELRQGGMVALAAAVPHDVSATTESVLLVTHALSR